MPVIVLLQTLSSILPVFRRINLFFVQKELYLFCFIPSKVMDFISYIRDQMGQPLSQKSGQDAGFGVSVVLADDKNFEATISTNDLTMVMFFATCKLLYNPFL